MGIKLKNKSYSLRMFFIKFILALIVGIIIGIVLPCFLFAMAQIKGYISFANNNELQVKEIANEIKTQKNYDMVDFQDNIKVLITNKKYDVLHTNMNTREQEDALKYAKGQYIETTFSNSKHFIMVTIDKEYCILQYYIGAHFNNVWLDTHMPLPERLLYIVIFLNCFVVCGVVVYLYAIKLKKELYPIMDEITRTDEQKLETGNLSSRIIEFNDILNSICDMKDGLKKSLTKQWNMEYQQKEQISALAHDLKTPLTVIGGNADLLAETDIDSEQEMHINYILDGYKCIEKYIMILMDVAKNEDKYLIKKENIIVKDFFDEINEHMQSVVAIKKISLISTLKVENFTIDIDKTLMERAIINLLSNAVEHSKIGGNIFLNIEKLGEKCKISILDEGSGFSKKALKYGTQKFFMDDSSRKQGKHYGMGLYIVNSIVEQHGGKIVLKNEKGARVDIII